MEEEKQTEKCICGSINTICISDRYKDSSEYYGFRFINDWECLDCGLKFIRS